MKTNIFSINDFIQESASILPFCGKIEEFYDYPFSVEEIGKLFYSALYLKSALELKAKIITSTYIEHPLLNRHEFHKLITDFLWFGNAYIERRRLKNKINYLQIPAKYTRKDSKNNFYYFDINHENKRLKFKSGSVFHLMQHDINQEIYGTPSWLAARKSALLNDFSTEFRQNFYKNGCHASFILTINNPALTEDEIHTLRDNLSNIKGEKGFKNIVIHTPNAQQNDFKLINLSEIGAKDEFSDIKEISRDDQLAACRVPPSLMGLVPRNHSSYGNIKDATIVFAKNEIQPIQNLLKSFNHFANDEIITFEDYKIEEIEN